MTIIPNFIVISLYLTDKEQKKSWQFFSETWCNYLLTYLEAVLLTISKAIRLYYLLSMLYNIGAFNLQ